MYISGMKRAIIIGLNYTGTGYALQDCELDADNMAVMLEACGVECEVTKGEATPTALISYLTSVAAVQHRKTDTLYIYFSGHGTQIPGKTEADKYNEAICLYDDIRGIMPLKDDDLRAALDQVPGTKIVVLDCCFAGGMEREVMRPDRKAKFIQFADGMTVYKIPDVLKREKAVSTGKTYFLFACQEREVSYSTGYGGLFTNALKTGRGNDLWTISKLLAFARVFCGNSQTPMAKIVGGNANKRVL